MNFIYIHIKAEKVFHLTFVCLRLTQRLFDIFRWRTFPMSYYVRFFFLFFPTSFFLLLFSLNFFRGLLAHFKHNVFGYVWHRRMVIVYVAKWKNKSLTNSLLMRFWMSFLVLKTFRLSLESYQEASFGINVYVFIPMFFFHSYWNNQNFNYAIHGIRRLYIFIWSQDCISRL